MTVTDLVKPTILRDGEFDRNQVMDETFAGVISDWSGSGKYAKRILRVAARDGIKITRTQLETPWPDFEAAAVEAAALHPDREIRILAVAE